MRSKKAFTLVELLVVVLILGLLATLAIGVYTTQVERARVAAAKTTISELELAVSRYQIDLGVFPPSLSASPVVGGCGLLEEALIHSIGGSAQAPSSPLWKGPYLNVKRENLGDINGLSLELSSPARGQIQILDPWKSPYRYVRSGPGNGPYSSATADSYYTAVNNATLQPSSYPYAATETWFNPSTFQIVSKGPNGTTVESPSGQYGLDGFDDVTNFGL
jgi:prepilin-type N-terminal cleavage/methylation domain-containing protein